MAGRDKRVLGSTNEREVIGDRRWKKVSNGEKEIEDGCETVLVNTVNAGI